MREDLLKGLTDEQIAKVKACKNQEEVLKLAKEQGIELTSEVQPLRKAFFHLNVGRGGKEHEFIQILFAHPDLILVAYDGGDNSRLDSFFHMVSRKKVAGFAGHLL